MNIDKLKDTVTDNRKLLRLYSLYLNEYPTMITEELVNDIISDCNVDEKTAYVSLLSAMLGLDTLENADDDRFEKEYILPSVTHLKADAYLCDPYLKNIRVPKASIGRWELTELEYKPYEGFIWNDITVKDDFKEIPSLGFFSENFKFPVVTENGREWMAIKPNEIETMRRPIQEVKGNVVTLGLGMGYFTYMASEKTDVKSVTVIERDENVIALFKEYILPQFEHADKINVINSDAFAYLDSLSVLSNVDYVFADIWHDASDGLELYLDIKKYEGVLKGIKFLYWIEDSLLSQLRSMLLTSVIESSDKGETLSIAGHVIDSYFDISRLLSNDNLKELSSLIKRCGK